MKPIYEIIGNQLEDKDLILEVAQEQDSKGVSRETILEETLSFVCMKLREKETQITMEANNKITSGIKTLEQYKEWSNINHIIKYAIKVRNEIFENEHPNKFESIKILHKLQKQAFEFGATYIHEIYNQQFIEKIKGE